MKKTQRIEGIVLIAIIIIAILSVNWTNFLVIKYISIAYAWFGIGYMLCVKLHHRKKQSQLVAHMIGIICLLIMMFYSILTLDTFIFHALTWYPGILRYAIYDAYGVIYVFFYL